MVGSNRNLHYLSASVYTAPDRGRWCDMAIGNTLIFDGIAWPAARVVNSRIESVFQTYPHDVDYGSPKRTIFVGRRKPPSRTIFTLAATGRGRRWETKRPQGFWRDFAELEIESAEAVTAFIRRRGDPNGWLDADTETHTGPWRSQTNFCGPRGGRGKRRTRQV